MVIVFGELTLSSPLTSDIVPSLYVKLATDSLSTLKVISSNAIDLPSERVISNSPLKFGVLSVISMAQVFSVAL